MKSYFKQLFSFNRRQQRGIAVLLILLLAASTAGWWLPITGRVKTGDNFSEERYKAEVAEFLKSHQPEQPPHQGQSNQFSEEPMAKKESYQLFKFNPNTLDDSGWLKLGIRKGQLKGIRNFQSKGGKFYKNEDVARLYCLSKEDYQRIEAYIDIPAPARKKYDSAAYASRTWEKKSAPGPVEVNLADSAALTAISGIGPAFASRIVKYRKRLGGFVKKDQLLEVFGMDSARYRQIEPMILIDTNSVVKININTVTFKELMRHPYFEFYMVKTICNEREKRKGFDSKSELLSLKLMYKELYVKIAPYICTSTEKE